MKMRIKLFFILISTLFLTALNVQSNNNDSLSYYFNNANIYFDSLNNKSVFFIDKTIKHAKSANNKEKLQQALILKSKYYYYIDENNKSITIINDALNISKDSAGEIYLYLAKNNIDLQNFGSALEYLNKAKKYSHIEDVSFQFELYRNYAIVYRNVGEPKIAIKKNKKAMEIAIQTKDTNKEMVCLLNIGNCYADKGLYSLALSNYNKILDIINDSYYKSWLHLPSVYNNIGWIHEQNENYKKALKYYELSYGIYDSLQDNRRMAILLNNMSYVLIAKGMNDKAEEKIILADSLFGQKDNLKSKKNFYHTVYKYHLSNNSYEDALEYLNLYYELKDSIYDKDLTKLLHETKLNYELEALKNKAKISQLQIEQQKTIITSLIVFLILILIFLIIIFKLYRDKNKLSIKLKNYNDEIIKKNKLISENLNYASLIQNACMSNTKSKSDKYFVFNKPLDLVGGDFYMHRKINNSEYWIVGDCTGHGISGGFLSVLSISYIDEALSNYSEPSKILNYLNNKFFNYFNSETGLGNESLCISIIKISESGNISYSGSKHKISHIHSDGTDIYNTSRYAIGEVYDVNYEDSDIDKLKGGFIYMYSDGFPDQFGGAEIKKLKYNRFHDVLLKASKLSISEQSDYLKKEFENWKGSCPQTDDVIVLGLNLNE